MTRLSFNRLPSLLVWPVTNHQTAEPADTGQCRNKQLLPSKDYCFLVFFFFHVEMRHVNTLHKQGLLIGECQMCHGSFRGFTSRRRYVKPTQRCGLVIYFYPLLLFASKTCGEVADCGSKSAPEQHGVMITFVSSGSNPLNHPGWNLLKIHKEDQLPAISIKQKKTTQTDQQLSVVGLMFMDDGRFQKQSSLFF